ncbi:MAG: hypothetical protein J7527_15500 [Chitinophagaceae bacterium]|nr:hypothetical protein [Chitinophagaceae bacterium]
MNLAAAVNLTAQLPADSPNPIIVVLGIQFEDVVNDVAYPLADSGHNTLAVIAVSQAIE